MFSPQEAIDVEVVTGLPADTPEPNDLATATKFVYAIRTLERKVQEEEESAKHLIAEIQSHRDYKAARLEEQIRFLTHLLKPFAQIQLEGKKERSIDTVAGRFGFRQLPDRVEVRQNEEFFGWAEANLGGEEQFIIVKESPSLKAIKHYIERTGEVPVGCELIKGEDSFFVKTKNDPNRGEVKENAEQS
jgi:phage host-nuclease inhibitor protein Gam